MPHKINPINFENAEGNLMIAVSLLEFLSRKLPISRLQRDLTDSTVTRNVGVAFGHIAVSYANIVKGLNKIQPNIEKIYKDLDENVAVLTEGIQTLMRKHGDEEAYEKLKLFSRNHQRITLTELRDFIQTLDVPEDARRKMIGLNMHNYTGTST
jgi:adenylosuccinate lyase